MLSDTDFRRLKTIPALKFLILHYSCSQLPPALGVFRRFLTHFLINFHEILQELFSTIPAPNQNFVFIEERHNSKLLHVKWYKF